MAYGDGKNVGWSKVALGHLTDMVVRVAPSYDEEGEARIRPQDISPHSIQVNHRNKGRQTIPVPILIVCTRTIPIHTEATSTFPMFQLTCIITWDVKKVRLV